MNRLLGLAAILCLLTVGCGGGGGGTKPGTAPAAPSNLIATATSPSSVGLQWIDESTDEDGFRIERQTNSGWIQIGQIGENATVFSVSGLTPSTPYTFRVRAFNGDGNSDYSNIASVTTPSEGPVPATPTNLAAAAQSSTSILLSWTDASSDETGFLIEVQEDGSWLQAGEATANATSYLHTGLAPNTSYTYRVYAFNGNGSSGPSNTATDRTLNEGTITIAAGTVSGVPGMTVSVAIAMTTTLTSLTGYSVSIDYDTTKLELIDVRQERLGLPMFQFAEPSDGRVVFAATATGAFTMTNGTIANVRFRIQDGATGNAAVTPVGGEVSDGTFRPMEATGFTAGSVQVQ
jgi:chitodextrinase